MRILPLLFIALISMFSHADDISYMNACQKAKYAMEKFYESPKTVLDDPKVIEFVERFPCRYSGCVGKYIIDINNDGQIDTVYALHSSTYAIDGDFYFSSFARNIDEKSIDEDVLSASAKHIFPQEWGGCSREKCAFDEYDDLELTSTESWLPNAPFRIRSRYLKASILVSRGVTYFYVYSEATSTGYALLKPNSDGSVTQICAVPK